MRLTTYNPTKPAGQFDVFILSKGNNAGKPMWQPCPNCFVLAAKTEEEQQQNYWLLYGLWQGQFFNPFITGSVIPFIRIDDVKQVLELAQEKVLANLSLFDLSLSMLQALEQHAANIHQQIKLIKQAKKVLMYKVLR